MSDLMGEQLVNLAVRDLHNKLKGSGGKNLGPKEKDREVNETIKKIGNIRTDKRTRKDAFFHTDKFRKIMSWLEALRTPSTV